MGTTPTTDRTEPVPPGINLYSVFSGPSEAEGGGVPAQRTLVTIPIRRISYMTWTFVFW
jgi:hypothetical protein